MSMLHKKDINALRDFLLRANRAVITLRDALYRYTAHDYQCLLLIVLLAAVLRLPMIDHPPATQFDEVIYADFTIQTITQKPFFDIHPPLARIIFTEVAREYFPFSTKLIPLQTNASFEDFPYVPLRTFIACVGILLALLLYAIGRVLGYQPRVALLPACFFIFDSALIVYSRTMHPDTLLLFFNFLALLFAFISVRVRIKYIPMLFVICAGVAIGLAISIKWTACGVLATIFLLFLINRKFYTIFIFGIVAFVTYITVFTLSFMIYFPNGGNVYDSAQTFTLPRFSHIEFPDTHNIVRILGFLPSFHHKMLNANSDPDLLKMSTKSANPLAWPVAGSGTGLVFWTNNIHGEQKIVFAGNTLLFVMSFFILLFDIAWIAAQLRKKHKWPIDKNESVLLAGYALNYLPFFLIPRPMYLYHYFTALVFLFLLAPKVLPRIIHCIAILSRDRLFAYVLVSFSLLLIALDFFINIPVIYGI